MPSLQWLPSSLWVKVESFEDFKQLPAGTGVVYVPEDSDRSVYPQNPRPNINTTQFWYKEDKSDDWRCLAGNRTPVQNFDSAANLGLMFIATEFIIEEHPYI